MIEKIKNILKYPLPEETQLELILIEMAKDENAISTILTLLNNERKTKKELISDMNVELSRCHLAIANPEIVNTKTEDGFSTKFILDEVSKFYLKYKDVIRHSFNSKF